MTQNLKSGKWVYLKSGNYIQRFIYYYFESLLNFISFAKSDR